ncbi:MAG: hypothetical protein QXU47_07925 [Candidatus Bathyarchaeia archaeon]
MSSEGEVRRGLTWRSLLALTFSLALVQPVMIYYYLISGQWFPLQAWIVILLWSEIAHYLGSPLTKQELFILLSFQWMASYYAGLYSMGGGYDFLKNMYMAYSQPSYALGVAQYVPSWWIPPETEVLRIYREVSFLYFDPVWLLPISITVLAMIFGFIADISMGYFTYSLYVKVEKLQFPAARAAAETVLTLGEREPTQMRILMLSILFGALYNLFVSFLPYLLGPYLSSGGIAIYATILPIAGTYDMTPIIAHFLPGFGFGFTLNLMYFVGGFILPIEICLAQFLGAFSYYSVGTYLITRFNLWPAESPYDRSWPMYLLVQRSQLYFYASFTIGLALAAAFLPIIIRPKTFVRAFSSLGKARGGEGEGPPLNLLLLAFIGACCGGMLLVYSLTGFPIWILALFMIGGSFFASFLGASAAGVTLTGFNVPMLRELMIYSSGWADKRIWFAPVSIYTGGPGVAQAFMQADILQASKSEYIKTYIIVFFAGILVTLLFVSYLWSLSPIPSSAYPATIIYWPVDAMNWARWQVWLWTGYFFRRELILGGFAAGSAIYLLTSLVFHKPYFLVAFITGAFGSYLGYSMQLESTMAMLIGSIIGNKVVSRILTKRSNISYGVFVNRFYMGGWIGWSLMESIRALLILVSRSMWLLPY